MNSAAEVFSSKQGFRDLEWANAGITPIKTPFQAPNANAYAERFLLSIKLGSGMLPLFVV